MKREKNKVVNNTKEFCNVIRVIVRADTAANLPSKEANYQLEDENEKKK